MRVAMFNSEFQARPYLMLLKLLLFVRFSTLLLTEYRSPALHWTVPRRVSIVQHPRMH